MIKNDLWVNDEINMPFATVKQRITGFHGRRPIQRGVGVYEGQEETFYTGKKAYIVNECPQVLWTENKFNLIRTNEARLGTVYKQKATHTVPDPHCEVCFGFSHTRNICRFSHGDILSTCYHMPKKTQGTL